jgi:hypothetical protein
MLWLPTGKERSMTTTPTKTRGSGRWGGLGLGGILVIAGIVVALVWSVLLGVIIAVIGLVAFGGFAKGKWY